MLRLLQPSEYIKIAALDRLYMDAPWSVDMIAMAVQYDTIFVVSDDTLAYGSYKLIDNFVEINNICVDASVRGKGYASAILQYILDSATSSNCNKIMLEVDENNIAAISLYAKFGFALAYKRNNYYGDKNAIVMSRRLI